KIAEGCDNGCSFCSIPIMRGKQISRPINSIVKEAERLVNNGVKELLVIAQDTTSYGWDLPNKTHLVQLLLELDNIGDSLKWIRLHYAHPAHLSQSIIESLAKMNKLCKYIDMPIQHASDKILSSMRRGLGLDGILDRIVRLRDAIPNIRLRTTVIIGYPGETEDDFNKLYDFINEVRFDRLGVFTYSEEENTYSAINYNDDIPSSIKQARMDEIMDVQREISNGLNNSKIGELFKVIIDRREGDYFIGRTEFDSPDVDNEVIVHSVNKRLRIGNFYNVRINSADDFDLIGEIE
ncbi:MAG: MiaB/RimO family radical SAM methylthiotransferase, partial [Bacteroidales bacterium]|nr:MiaB/RimO family radical SAM methylthiotransferase [Bacteroidales bacterium]